MTGGEAPPTVDLLLSAARALWQIPTPNLRAVAVAGDGDGLRLRLVYEAEPSREERELASLAGTYVVADFPGHEIQEVVEVAPPPAERELNPGEHWVYLRYEPGNWGNL